MFGDLVAPLQVMLSQLADVPVQVSTDIPAGSPTNPAGSSAQPVSSSGASQTAASMSGQEGMMQFSLEEACHLPPISLFSSTGDVTVPW